MGAGQEFLEQISQRQNPETYRQEHWQGSLSDYLDLVKKSPQVTRTAYQRLYDMVLEYGTYPVEGSKEGLIRYRFFDDPDNGGRDAIFGLTKPLMELVNIFKSASLKYGSERRVLLLHGPVGSSKSTIARLLKRGLERYSRKEQGTLYTYGWNQEDGSILWCPMHEEPLHLISEQSREEICEFMNRGNDQDDETAFQVDITGELCPLCRFMFKERLDKSNGNWSDAIKDVVIKRLLLSEPDRIGIGTFQP